MKNRTCLSLLLAAAFVLMAGVSRADERYTVAAGDTLTKIGQRFGVSYRDIMVANNLRTTTIYSGQVLVIPTGDRQPRASAPNHTYPRAASTERYTAPPVPGYSETAPYRGTVTESNRGGNSAVPPYRAPIPKAKPVRGVRVPANASLQTYTVQFGDTVRSISRKFGVSFWDLRRENDIMFSRIVPGQVLRIPPKSDGFFNFFPF